jgi:hypothetical protein
LKSLNLFGSGNSAFAIRDHAVNASHQALAQWSVKQKDEILLYFFAALLYDTA